MTKQHLLDEIREKLAELEELEEECDECSFMEKQMDKLAIRYEDIDHIINVLRIDIDNVSELELQRYRDALDFIRAGGVLPALPLPKNTELNRIPE